MFICHLVASVDNICCNSVYLLLQLYLNAIRKKSEPHFKLMKPKIIRKISYRYLAPVMIHFQEFKSENGPYLLGRK